MAEFCKLSSADLLPGKDSRKHKVKNRCACIHAAGRNSEDGDQVRGQRAEGRGQRAEGRGQRADELLLSHLSSVI